MKFASTTVAAITILGQQPFASAEEDVMLRLKQLENKFNAQATENAKMKAEITTMKEREAKLASLLSSNGKTNLRRLDDHGDGSYELLYLYLQSFHEKYEKFEDVRKCLDHSIVGGKDVCTLGGSTGIDAVLIGSAGPNKPDIKIDGNEVDTNALSSIGMTAPTVVTNTESCSGSCFDDVNPCVAYNDETDTCAFGFGPDVDNVLIGDPQDPPNIEMIGGSVIVGAKNDLGLLGNRTVLRGLNEVDIVGSEIRSKADRVEINGKETVTIETGKFNVFANTGIGLIGKEIKIDSETLNLGAKNISAAVADRLELSSVSRSVEYGLYLGGGKVTVRGMEGLDLDSVIGNITMTATVRSTPTGGFIVAKAQNDIGLSGRDINLNADNDVNLNGDANNVGGGDVYAKTGNAAREVVSRGIGPCVNYDAGTDTCKFGFGPDVDNILIGNEQNRPDIELYGKDINVDATDNVKVYAGDKLKLFGGDEVSIESSDSVNLFTAGTNVRLDANSGLCRIRSSDTYIDLEGGNITIFTPNTSGPNSGFIKATAGNIKATAENDIDITSRETNIAAIKDVDISSIKINLKAFTNDLTLETPDNKVSLRGAGIDLASNSGNITLEANGEVDILGEKGVAVTATPPSIVDIFARDINLNANLDVNLIGDADLKEGGNVYAKAGIQPRAVVCRRGSC